MRELYGAWILTAGLMPLNRADDRRGGLRYIDDYY